MRGIRPRMPDDAVVRFETPSGGQMQLDCRRVIHAARDANRRALILQYVGELSMLGVAPSKNRVEEKLKIDNLTLRGREMSAYFNRVQIEPFEPQIIMYTRPNSYVHEIVISTPRNSATAAKSREAAPPAGKK